MRELVGRHRRQLRTQIDAATRWLALWLVVVLGGCGRTEEDQSPVCVNAWRELRIPAELTDAHTGAAARRGQSAVWTGTELVIWGGTMTDPIGIAWTPPDAYRALPAEGAPVPDGIHVLLAERNGVVVAESSLGSYDPGTDTWSSLPPIPGPGEFASAAATAGDVLLVQWAAPQAEGVVTEYWAYDGSWREVPTSWLQDGSWPMISLGDSVLAWGVMYPNYPNKAALGARYIHASNTWMELNTVNQPTPRYDAAFVSTGREAIIWGGGYYDEARGQSERFRDGARYDPEADAWTPMNSEGAPDLGGNIQAYVAADDRMIVYGRDPDLETVGAVYDIPTDSWSNLTSLCGPPAFDLPSLTWVDSGLILWAGPPLCPPDAYDRNCPALRERAWFLPSEAIISATTDPDDCRCPSPM